jgi:hypothetical protein
VRPLLSVTAIETTTGTRTPRAAHTSSIATSAALVLSVSICVSTSSRSAPPSSSPRACSAKASHSSRQPIARLPGSFTSGEIESVRVVGPIAPATKRGLSGVRAVHASATRRQMRAPARFIS